MSPLERSVGNQRSLPAHKQRWKIGKMSRSTAVAPRGVDIPQLGIAIQHPSPNTIPPPLYPFQSTYTTTRTLSFLITPLNQSKRPKPGALLAETPTASSHMVALQILSVLWNSSIFYKQEPSLLKKQTWNGTTKAIEMNFKTFGQGLWSSDGGLQHNKRKV
jgi:hypothetical protein